MKKRVLILGSGSRESAMSLQMSYENEVYLAPGNAWAEHYATLVPLKPIKENFSQLIDFVLKNRISLIIVGPEDPLCAGFKDFVLEDLRCTDAGVKVIGPTQAASALESSKWFAKQFMLRNGIPTALAELFTVSRASQALSFLEKVDYHHPVVLKADGLCAGKGVAICPTLDEAKATITAMFEGKFGSSGTEVLIEEFLPGIEMSVFALIDDNGDYVILPSAKDYKRQCSGDKGPNTGGMGAVAPVPFFTNELQRKVEDRILKPTIAGMRYSGIPYSGFLYLGLMIVNGEPYVVEYNCRMGDPETPVVLDLLDNQFSELIWAAAGNRLKDFKLQLMNHCSVGIVIASQGYPENPVTGREIFFTERHMRNLKNYILLGDIIGAGVKMEGNAFVTSGGRICLVIGRGDTIAQARDEALKLAFLFTIVGMQFRADIGNDLIALSAAQST